MNAANLENTSSESDVVGRVGDGRWTRMKVERMGMMKPHLPLRVT
jgi:hypothetical protein